MHQSLRRFSPSTRTLEREADSLATRVRTTPRSVSPISQASDHRLDDGTRSVMERAFNHDFSRIRVHHNSTAADLSARAYTVGNDLVFALGQYQPSTTEGQHLIAHELAHSIQQESAGPMLQRAPAKGDDAKKALGERLWREFPAGVNVAFYMDGYDEAQRRASDWAKREHAVGLKGKGISGAANLAFDKAISDMNDLGPTLTGMSGVLHDAAMSVEPPAGVPIGPGMGPDKVTSLALFSHGTSNWCGLGPITTGNAAQRAKSMAPALAVGVNVILYSCNGARGSSEDENWVKGTMEGGGADSLAGTLRDALLAEGIVAAKVWGHTTTGHPSTNLALREFLGRDGKGAAGQSYISTYVFTATDRAGAVSDLEEVITAQRLTIDDPTKFAKQANQALTSAMYSCWYDATQALEYGGAKLGEAAPNHPTEVAELVKKHWTDTYWPGHKEKVAKALSKTLKLKPMPAPK